MNKKIGISEFVKRQTIDSQFTDYDESWEHLELWLNMMWKENAFLDKKPGYRDGVLLVSVNPNHFYTYTNFPMFEGMRLEADWEKVPGREYEPSKLQVKIKENKKQCKFVDIILYKKEVLEEDGDKITGADWDIISINGRLNKNPKPMDPMTIIRNWKNLPGGTRMKGKTVEDVLEMLCESIMRKNGIKK